MGKARKGFGNVLLKDVTMKRVRVEEFEASLCENWGWVNFVFLQGFSLKILSGSSLHFVDIRGIYTRVRVEYEESVFQNRAGWRLGLATWLSCEFQPRGNWMASLYFLSYSAPAGMMLQLLACLARVQLSATCKPQATREIQSRVPATLHNLEHFFTLSHTLPLYDSHLNTGLLIAKIQANLVWKKANKMVDKIQHYK